MRSGEEIDTGAPKLGEHAVVVGASIAGLLAARVLADAYERVTIVERDELPAAVGEGRRAIPQGRHLHALLASGKRCFDDLLPGLTDDLFAAGAVPCSVLDETLQVFNGHPLARERAGIDNLLASRPLIEGHVRRRVRSLPNLSTLERCEARSLITSPDRSRVSGVRVRDRDRERPERDLDADLVVAASGRSSRISAWLEALGYEPPEEERLDVDLMYVSRGLRLRDGGPDGAKLVLIGPKPGLPRGLGLFAQEGGRWLMTASGYGPERPPSDEEGLLRFVASVVPPGVLAALRDAEPLGEIATHRFAANQRRRFENLKRFPDGLLAIGDAICSFNPLYGQGMSVAALEAVELRRCLEGGERELARRFFGAAAKAIDPAWELAIGGDLALPEVPGRRPIQVRIGNAYGERALRTAVSDPVVAEALARVGDLLEPPAHLMSPRVLWRVARGGRRRGPVGSDRSGERDPVARTSERS